MEESPLIMPRILVSVKKSIRSFSSDRNTQLQLFKQRWLAMGPGNDRIEERDALALVTINALSCSKDMVELNQMLKDQRISIGRGGSFDMMASNFFLSTNSEKGRKTLLELISEDDSSNIVFGWCKFAGRTCPEDKFEEFHSALMKHSKVAAGFAMIGRNMLHVKVDPEAAISTSLQSLAEMSNEQRRENDIYLNLQLASLPSTSDFGRIELVINQYNTSTKDYQSSRDELFKSWAMWDPAGAANYVMDHPLRLESNLISIISNNATADSKSTILWVKTFPEGDYRDAASQGAVDAFLMSDPDVAQEAASLIADGKKRADALQKIEGARAFASI